MYPPTPAKTSTTGPKVLTFLGAGVMLAAVVVAVLVVRLFLSVVPLGVVTADGDPGPEAVGGTSVPGSVSLELDAESTYVVYLARPSGADVELTEPVTVTDPSGAELMRTPSPSSTSTQGGVTATDVYTFRTGAAGAYTVQAPPLADPHGAGATPWATIVVAPGDDFPSFFSGLFGTVFGVFLAIGLGVLGLGMVIGGAIWWYVRSRARSAPGIDFQ